MENLTKNNPEAAALFHAVVIILIILILLKLIHVYSICESIPLKTEGLVSVPVVSAEANANANSRHDQQFTQTSQDTNRDDYNIELLRKQGLRYT